jgi:hypothetical protein
MKNSLHHRHLPALVFALFLGGGRVDAAGAPGPDQVETVIRAAIMKSLPLLTAGARGSMEQRGRCFTCHSQALPIMALGVARSRGFEIDSEELTRQLEFTAAFLHRNREVLSKGKGLGGQVNTAGSALEALAAGGWKPDETTAAAAEYLLLWQKNLPHWSPSSQRPPTQSSPFTATYLALLGLRNFGTEDQSTRIAERFERALEWLKASNAKDTEDHVFRLRALRIAGANESVDVATQELLKRQGADGGWSQLPDLASDPYATATALTALHEAGGLLTGDSAYMKGVRFLLGAQLEDGSWHVATRSKPIQTYFESGYPHGKDQFISITAASWATMALALTLPKTNP